jgi:hypothetical protein
VLDKCHLAPALRERRVLDFFCFGRNRQGAFASTAVQRRVRSCPRG